MNKGRVGGFERDTPQKECNLKFAFLQRRPGPDNEPVKYVFPLGVKRITDPGEGRPRQVGDIAVRKYGRSARLREGEHGLNVDVGDAAAAVGQDRDGKLLAVGEFLQV